MLVGCSLPGVAAFGVRGTAAMSKRTAIVLLLACLAGGGVVLTIGFEATKPLSLRVGTTIRDPGKYFDQQLRAHHSLSRVTLTSLPSGGVYTYDTSFVILGRRITSRTSVYQLDTNGTVLSIYSRRCWPILRF